MPTVGVNAAIHPGVAEICDGIDNNCNFQIDEGVQVFAYYPDNDGDGYGNSGASVVYSCSPLSGYVSNNWIVMIMILPSARVLSILP